MADGQGCRDRRRVPARRRSGEARAPGTASTWASSSPPGASRCRTATGLAAEGGRDGLLVLPARQPYFPTDRPGDDQLPRRRARGALRDGLEGAGIAVERRAEWDHPEVGLFARIHDPEGNPIELWEPPAAKGQVVSCAFHLLKGTLAPLSGEEQEGALVMLNERTGAINWSIWNGDGYWNGLMRFTRFATSHSGRLNVTRH